MISRSRMFEAGGKIPHGCDFAYACCKSAWPPSAATITMGMQGRSTGGAVDWSSFVSFTLP